MVDSEELSEEYGYLRPVSALNFDSSNWNEWQYVQIQGVDDRIDDDDQTYTLSFDASGSADSNYQALTEAELLGREEKVEIKNKDNDSAGVTARVAKLYTYEDASEVNEIKVRLNTEPTSEVKIIISSTDQTKGVLTKEQLTFTPQNYDKEQKVDLVGVEDEYTEPPELYRVEMRAESTDDNYGNRRGEVTLLSIDEIDNYMWVSNRSMDLVSFEADAMHDLRRSDPNWTWYLREVTNYIIEYKAKYYVAPDGSENLEDEVLGRGEKLEEQARLGHD